MNIAAIRWLVRGREKPPVIQYMLLNKNFEYLIFPQEIEVRDLKKDIKFVFNAIETIATPNIPLKICYKSILMGYWRPRRDSKKFHRLLNKILKKRKLLENSDRTFFLLKKEELVTFKKALYFLDIDCKTKGLSYVAHLWTIALHVTGAGTEEAIKKIWKSRYDIKRMNKENLMNFKEFYSLLK